MKTKDIRNLSADDITIQIGETRKQIVEHRFARATAKLTNIAAIRQARKTLARLLTIQTEQIGK